MAGEDDVHATTDPDLASSITTEDVSGAEDPRSSHGLDPEVSPDPHSEPEKVSERSTVRRGLPEELSKGVVVLECESSAEGGSCDVYIVGTAHVSLVIFPHSFLDLLIIYVSSFAPCSRNDDPYLSCFIPIS